MQIRQEPSVWVRSVTGLQWNIERRKSGFYGSVLYLFVWKACLFGDLCVYMIERVRVRLNLKQGEKQGHDGYHK